MISLAIVLAVFFILTTVAQAQQRVAGVSSGGFDWSTNPPKATGLQATNNRAERQHAIYNWFQPLHIANPSSYFDLVPAEGAAPMTTLEITNDGNLDSILNGKYDSAIDAQARAIANAKYDGPVYVRLLHEMNSNWYSWGVGTGSNTPAKYRAAWQRMYNRMEPIAPNIEWVFCPNIKGSWNGGQTPFANLYPGDAYVDHLALDGYNFAGAKNEPWKTFTQVFQTSYNELVQLHPTKPVMIVEFSSWEDPNNSTRKADWITDAFTKAVPNTMPRISTLMWFDNDRTVQEGVNLRNDTSQNSLAAYRKVVNSASWGGSNPQLRTSEPKPGLTAQASFNFSAPNGSTWPSPWTKAHSWSGTSHIRDNHGRVKKSAAAWSPGAMKLGTSWTSHQVADLTLKGRVRVASPGRGHFVGVRFRAAGDKDWYRLVIDSGTGRAVLQKSVDGSITDLSGSASTGHRFGWAEKRIRIKAVGNRLFYKVWSANRQEPDRWSGSATDATHAGSGAVVVEYNDPTSAANFADFDSFTVTPR